MIAARGRPPDGVPAHSRTSPCPPHNGAARPRPRAGPDQSALPRASERRSRPSIGGGRIRLCRLASVFRRLEMDEADFQADLEARWAVGGLGAFISTHPGRSSIRTRRTRVGRLPAQQDPQTVADPATAELLCRTRHPLGVKRLCVDTGFHETFNRDPVTLVDLAATPIERIVPEGIETSGGRHEVDTIVFATGFDAMTGALAADRHPRARRARARRQVGRRPAHLPRRDERGLPQPVHHHRPGQPVGDPEHGGVDRAACRMDRRLARRTRTARCRRGRAAARGRKGRGENTSTRSPRRPSSCTATAGTSAPTSPASRGCSRPTSAG